MIQNDDTISRQAAIDTFYEMASDIDHLCTVGDYVHVLEGLPSAQPEMDCQKCIFCGFAGFKQFQTAQSKTEERLAETAQNVPKDDLISRKAAIDVLEERLHANGYSNVALVSELNRSIGYLMRLPSAQPEITRCKDCEHWTNDDCPFAWGKVEDAFCSYAERRTDE